MKEKKRINITLTGSTCGARWWKDDSPLILSVRSSVYSLDPPLEAIPKIVFQIMVIKETDVIIINILWKNNSLSNPSPGS
jgi:hypothetical protein